MPHYKRFKELKPHPFQVQIYDKIRQNWLLEDPVAQPEGKQYGNIVYLETGTGKTYIAIMLLKHLFGEVSDPPKSMFEKGDTPEVDSLGSHPILKPLNDDEIAQKRTRNDAQNAPGDKESSDRPRVGKKVSLVSSLLTSGGY